MSLRRLLVLSALLSGMLAHAEIDKSISEQTLTLENGQSIHVYKKGDPNAPMIIFLHGFPEFGYAWKDQLLEFGKDYFAVAPDLRGYNLSSKPKDASEYQVGKVMEDIDLLASKLTNQKFVIVGHDWGGPVAWVYAMVHPEKLKGLIAINGANPFVYNAAYNNPADGQKEASVYIDQIRAGKINASTMTASNSATLKEVVFSSVPFFNDSMKQEYERAWSQPEAIESGLKYYLALNWPPAPPTADQLKIKISVPALVIWGMKDPYVVSANADSPLLKESVSNLTIRHIPDAGHWVIHERPEEVNVDIRQFLSTL